MNVPVHLARTRELVWTRREATIASVRQHIQVPVHFFYPYAIPLLYIGLILDINEDVMVADPFILHSSI